MIDSGSSKGFINRLLYDKRFTIPFSILLAIIFWLVISTSQNPLREITINSVPININTDNTMVSELGLDIIGDYPQTADVVVSGPSYIVTSLTASDLVVSASLSNVTASGTYDIDLYASRNSSKVGYTIAGVSPAFLTLTFDNIDTDKFQVIAVANGASAVEGLVAESAVVTDSEYTNIEIRGPRSEMEKIASVEAVADVNRVLSTTESFDAKIILYNEAHEEIDKSPFTLPAEKIKISVPISRKKEVGIVATFSNAPDFYTQNPLSYTLSENKVTIIGPPETIDTIETVKLAPIDFREIYPGKDSFDVALSLPTAVKTVDNIESVTVKLDLSNISTTTVTVGSFLPVGLDPELSMTPSGNIKSVKICGSRETLAVLPQNSLYAQVDVTGKSAGEYTLPAKILSRTYNNIWQVGEYTVIVKIS